MAVIMKFKILIIFIFLILLVVLAGLIAWNIFQSPVDSNSEEYVEVVIPSGAGVGQIATILKEKDLIRNPEFFKLYIKINKSDSLKATTYKLKKNMSTDEIIKALEKGNSYNPDAINITIQEGLNMRQIALIISNRLSNRG